MTSQILYREPTHEEMYGKKGTATGNLFAWIFLIAVFFGLGLMLIKTAERESANQVQAIVKAVEVAK
ncbi:hypothetical protein [Acinetobacter sp. SAAs470]|nr:hypothetical protein [Acinetobacter sp. SAAs470]WOE32781.1 hypothetical protein QSG84_06295 [Acinetobacter sp. SAAs470]WOE38258.1 hypothetical protein QSG86_15350 [Acinetobacter sp. SAAs474]